MSSVEEDLVARAIGPLADERVPPALRDSIERHRGNLLGLASALLAGGQDRAAVEAALETVFASYRSELTKVILELSEAGDAR